MQSGYYQSGEALNQLLPLTCPLPAALRAGLLVNLPALLEVVAQCQHGSSAQGVHDQEVSALERPPKEADPDHKLFTRLRQHVVLIPGTASSPATDKHTHTHKQRRYLSWS